MEDLGTLVKKLANIFNTQQVLEGQNIKPYWLNYMKGLGLFTIRGSNNIP